MNKKTRAPHAQPRWREALTERLFQALALLVPLFMVGMMICASFNQPLGRRTTPTLPRGTAARPTAQPTSPLHYEKN
jgi:hypothetical protein